MYVRQILATATLCTAVDRRGLGPGNRGNDPGAKRATSRSASVRAFAAAS